MKTRTYFLCPAFTYQPESISLGHVIPSPSKPAIALNLDANFQPTAAAITCEVQDNVVIPRQHPFRLEFGLIQKYLHIIGFGIDAGETSTMERKDRFDFSTIETIYYNPSAEDVRRALGSAGVMDFFTASVFRRPLYLVVEL
ncbi:hypothetical protein F5Y10DRAFT_273743 [Nemania abortiva]|nr:hypothetical protein F5Y10DRAFT_273743 [Nemania abortiva]